MSDLAIEEQLEALEKKIQEYALRLCDLDVIIHDYNQERQRLLDEFIELKQQFWDLVESRHGVKRET